MRLAHPKLPYVKSRDKKDEQMHVLLDSSESVCTLLAAGSGSTTFLIRVAMLSYFFMNSSRNTQQRVGMSLGHIYRGTLKTQKPHDDQN